MASNRPGDDEEIAIYLRTSNKDGYLELTSDAESMIDSPDIYRDANMASNRPGDDEEIAIHHTYLRTSNKDGYIELTSDAESIIDSPDIYRDANMASNRPDDDEEIAIQHTYLRTSNKDGYLELTSDAESMIESPDIYRDANMASNRPGDDEEIDMQHTYLRTSNKDGYLELTSDAESTIDSPDIYRDANIQWNSIQWQTDDNNMTYTAFDDPMHVSNIVELDHEYASIIEPPATPARRCVAVARDTDGRICKRRIKIIIVIVCVLAAAAGVGVSILMQRKTTKNEVTDNELPTILGTPSDMTINMDTTSATASAGNPTASDYSGDVTLTSDAMSGSNFPIGSSTMTFTATDPSGNPATDSFKITVTDDELPTITGTPSDMTTTTDANSATAAVSWTDPTASDNSGDVTLTSDATSGSHFPIGTSTVTFTAMDYSGNKATDSFMVTVTDDELPTITGTPSDMTTTTDTNTATAAVSWTDPTASDNSGGDVTLTSDTTSGSHFPIGTSTVTFTAMDPSGNQATNSFQITVTDDELPTITGTPSDMTTTTDANSATAAVSWSDPTASDNSGDVTLTSVPTSGSNFPIGTSTVTFTAMDPSGNQATNSFMITVKDDELPSITGTPSDIITVQDGNSAVAAVSWADPTVSDNSGDVTLTSDPTSGSHFPIGKSTVTFTATDRSGNQATNSFKITVAETTTAAIRAVFYGKVAEFDHVVDTKTISWKQGSVFGIGGDRHQTYKECLYRMDDGKFIVVFIQANFGIPRPLTLDSKLQFGFNSDNLFFVLHDKEQKPYQYRFEMNTQANTLLSGNDILESITGFDASWIVGDYLHNL
ncbi:uncharacterized protein [Amphiura filiformis]|uniref:uncharacterized protein n=1 Tax=Amphiura filiformis TaxID=82378 RepID=UPI003B217396